MFKNLTDYDNKDSLVNRIRNARFHFFEERLKALGPGRLTVLDVGGFEKFWVNRGYNGRDCLEITLLNLEEEPTHYPNLRSVKGNACDMREFTDRQFDVVFSNSVIEHLHTYESQQAMAREVQRVGRHHFVQTPNRYFFIEPHFLLPWFQFMPRAVQIATLTKTSLARFKRLRPEAAQSLLDEIRLLSEQEFRGLFPKSQLYEEKFLGMIKSFTAHNL
ncbi:MAG: methyltransferase domain-containing protein [Luteitalea sp.]|nr:methyltransferase domain-containing protein [Luteitalea sp.]